MKYGFWPFVLLISVSVVEAAKPAEPSPFVYVSSDIFASVVEVEVATGDRRYIDLDRWPQIIKATDFAVRADGTFLIETTDATQRVGIWSINPSTGARTPISGGVDGFATGLLGDGPPLSSLGTLLCNGDRLFALPRRAGPFSIDIPSGDRLRTVADDGVTTPLLTATTDMVFQDSQTVIVADRFEGLHRVRLPAGDPTPLFAPGTTGSNPWRMDVTDDGRLLWLLPTGEPALWERDLRTGEDRLFSGSFGGNDVGTGAPFRLPYDVMIDPWGRIFVYDVGAAALVQVDGRGNRTVVASPSVGTGADLFDNSSTRPMLGTWERPVAAPLPSAWVVY